MSAPIFFSLPANAKSVNILLFDLYQNVGQQLMKIPADELTNSAQVNTSNLNTGIYVVYLEVEGIGVASEQLMVIH